MKKNLIKKMSSLLLAFMLLFTGMSSAFAGIAPSGNLKVKYLNGYIRLSGGFFQQATRLTINGIEVFCIDPNRYWAANQNYGAIDPYKQVQTIKHGSHTTKLTADKIQTFEKVTYHGFYKQPSDKNKVLTQALVFDVLYGRTPTQVGSYSLSDYRTFKNKVMADVNNHKSQPSFHGNTLSFKPGETKVLTDKNNIIQKLKMPSTTNGFKFSKSGNNLTITAPNKELKNTYYRFGSANSGHETTVYLNSGSQTTAYANAEVKFNGGINLSVVPQNHKLTLQKTSANKTLTDIAKAGYSLKGAEYGVYNTKVNALNNKNLLNKLITDDKGKSNTLDLAKGKYFVKELKAPKGFKLDQTIYTVDLTTKDQVLNVKDEPLFDPLNIMLKKQNQNGKALEGAEFTVKYYNEILTSTKGKTPVRTWKFKTDKKGAIQFNENWKISGPELFKDQSGATIGLIGTYEFIETKAPKGYILDPTPVLAYVKEQGAENPGTVYNMPIVKNESAEKELKLVKIDSETGKQIAQSGVTFNILDKDMKKLTIGGESEFKTNDKGIVTLKEKVLPGIYYIKEIKAPSGYYLDPNGKAIKIEIFEKDTKVIIKEIKNTPQKGRLILEKKANLLVDTKANEKDKTITDLIYKDGFLANTKWELRAKEEIKSLDGVTVLYKKGDLVENLITNSTSEVSSKELPLGKYTLKEVSAPKEYLVDPKVYDIEFTPQSQEVRVSSKSVKAYNERKELTFEFNKKFEDTKLFTIEPKATFGLFLNEDYKENGITVKKDTLLDKVTIDVNNITEKVTEKEVNGTKEVKEDVISYEVSTFTEKEVENKDKPIIKTEEYSIFEVKLQNGEIKVFNTKEEALSFIEKQKDKANLSVKEVKKSEDVIVGYETKIEKTLDKVLKFNTKAEKDKKIAELEQKGIIYSVKEFKTTVTRQVEDTENKIVKKLVERTAKGKFKDILIDGKFYIKEISTAKGYVLDNTKHETGFDFKTTDKKQNTVIGANIVNKLNKITLDVTKIEAGSVEEGSKKVVSGAEYVLIATDSEKGETTVGKYITDENGKIVVENLPNGNYIFKELNAPDGYFKNEEEINLNFTDEKDGSTYKVEVINEKIPEIRTTAVDNETGKKTVNPINIIQIKDIVKYKDLIIGKEYVMKGVLMDKETNKPILDKKGKEVRAEKTFIPKTRNGEVELIFTLNADILRGKTTVVFEDLYKDGKLLVSHADINDKDQTIKITNPKIGTTFSEIVTNEKVLDPMGTVTLVDNVDYHDLIKGEEYTANLKVMDKSTNKPLVINGKEVVGSTTFIAKEEKGTVKVSVDIDLTKVRGKEIVAFEKLIYKGEVIAAHEDINDENQTVKITNPNVRTTLIEKGTNNKEVHAEKVTLIDKVKYSNVIQGKKYNLDGQIVRKDTKEVLATSSITFVAKSSTGIIGLEFLVDASKLEGKEIVAFETLSREKVELSVHADINDKDQTVKVNKVKAGTKASYVDGSKEKVANSKMTIVDIFEYDGLIKGQKYVVDGILMDKETNKALLVNRKTVTGKTTFTAKNSKGNVEVRFTFDGSKLANKELVVFEKLSHVTPNGNVLIASHEDINDKGQTVKVLPIPSTPYNPNTGDTGIFAVISTLVISVVALYFVTKKQRQINR
ncbi:VaFE repeat-containing surface-anchored protein [Helcococcus kunzii]|uniref:VaFE repeat-containing surface-anchored protein n=1 Tax=Helcococcus kunzii TaxID=40091 RepID=UPI0024ACD472|nr:VaFE repeat-containing surface-anchored protein [Helcococcus kunzii]